MKHYIFTVEHASLKRGYNRTIRVWRMERNVPMWVGDDDEVSTAAYAGDYAVACKIISIVDKYRLTKGGYGLQNKNVKLHEIR